MNDATARYNVIVTHPTDNVGTLICPVDTGDQLRIRRGEEFLTLVAIEAIDLCHKVALMDLPAGSPVLKYGQVIGQTRCDVSSGGHVHVHNLRSLRAQVA